MDYVCIIPWADELPGVVGQVPMARGWYGRLSFPAKALDVQRLSKANSFGVKLERDDSFVVPTKYNVIHLI